MNDSSLAKTLTQNDIPIDGEFPILLWFLILLSFFFVS